jgi:hypothetical protein
MTDRCIADEALEFNRKNLATLRRLANMECES